MRYVRSPGARLLVNDAGPTDAPAIMLSNSLGATHHMWDGVAAILTERFRVVRYDTRGHGGSMADDSPFEIEDLACDAIAILDALGIDKVHFAGLSLGGMTGQVLGADHPGRLASLALLATSAYMPPASGWTERAARVRREGAGAILPATLERWFTSGFMLTSPDAVMPIADAFMRTDREGYAACCEAISRMDLRSRILGLTVPTLVIAGANDIATPPSMGRDLCRAIIDAQLVVLEPAAHLLAVEQPGEVAKLLSQHVLRHALQGAACS